MLCLHLRFWDVCGRWHWEDGRLAAKEEAQTFWLCRVSGPSCYSTGYRDVPGQVSWELFWMDNTSLFCRSSATGRVVSCSGWSTCVHASGRFMGCPGDRTWVYFVSCANMNVVNWFYLCIYERLFLWQFREVIYKLCTFSRNCWCINYSSEAAFLHIFSYREFMLSLCKFV